MNPMHALLRLVVLGLVAFPWSVYAQTRGADPEDPAPFGSPVEDRHVFMHVIAEQLEARYHSGDSSENSMEWDAEAWMGGDWNRLWIKSEGSVGGGRVQEGLHEAFYARPITTYFDAQIGVRYDRDVDPSRTWFALGIEGLAPQWFNAEATVYAREGGHFAGRVRGSYDVLLTQRLILQPELELNFYSRSDPRRGIGTGLSRMEAGLRLRYEVRRKLAPYLGVSFERTFGSTSSFASMEGEREKTWSAVIGVRSWY